MYYSYLDPENMISASQINPPGFFAGNPGRPPSGRPPSGRPPSGPSGRRPPGGGMNVGPNGAPLSPPPSTVPQKLSTFRVDPGSIRHCIGSFTYIWLDNGSGFWMFPLQVGRDSVFGFRWNRFAWVYFGISLNRIDAFMCS